MSTPPTTVPAPPPAEEPYRTQQNHQFWIVDGEDTSIAQVNVAPRHGGYFITSVYCHPAHRRKGLIYRLLGEAITAYGHHDLYLNVWAFTNQPRTDDELIRYYSRFGFALVPGAAGHMHRPPGPYVAPVLPPPPTPADAAAEPVCPSV